MNNTTIADFFKQGFNIDWKDLEQNEPVNVEHFNRKIKSYNNITNTVEMKKVTSIVRKTDSQEYMVKINNDVLKCSGDHKIAVKTNLKSKDFTYLAANVLTRHLKFYSLDSNLNWTPCKVKATNNIIPILDVSVEDNHNYFSNNILSHNSYGNPEVSPGGKSLKFYSSIRLEIRKIEFISKGTDVVGLKSRIKTTKNKTAPPMRKGEFEIIFGEGFQTENEWAEYIVDYDIVKGKPGGSWFDIVNPFNGDEVKVQGKNTGVANYLNDHPDFKEWAINEAKKRMFPNQTFEEIVSIMNKEDAKKKVDDLVAENESVTDAPDFNEEELEETK